MLIVISPEDCITFTHLLEGGKKVDSGKCQPSMKHKIYSTSNVTPCPRVDKASKSNLCNHTTAINGTDGAKATKHPEMSQGSPGEDGTA